MAASVSTDTNYADEFELLQTVVAKGPGWQRAFATAVNAYRPYLLQRCMRHLRNLADAEDVLQEVFLNAYRFADRYQGRASVKTWLTTIADNQCYTFLRKKQRYSAVQHLLAVIDIHETAQADVEARSGEQRHLVAEAMAGLPPKAREILSLRYWLDLPLEEIAQTLGIGLSATKMRLHRAHRQCFDVIDPECAMNAGGVRG